MNPERGRPLLMLYSVVDDRSAVAYQQYHGVYGEYVEAALRFLFTGMSAKKVEDFPALLNQGMISLNFQRFLNGFKR
ncbi:putative integrase protein [Richelia intracellularis]|nr:hypothetical protein RintRC_4761 [Richelia intracellularis]CDN16997.1 putative integrase protein [Richelia intracellularis]